MDPKPGEEVGDKGVSKGGRGAVDWEHVTERWPRWCPIRRSTRRTGIRRACCRCWRVG